MKKNLIKIISFVILVGLMLTITGCLSEEEKNLIKQYEEEATKVMKDYLANNYSGAKILDVEQQKSFDTGNGYTIHSWTEFLVKYRNKKYLFYYDKDTQIVYSNVNYDKITAEIKNYIIKKDNLNTDFLSSFSINVLSGGINNRHKVIRDSDKSLADFINTNNMNKREYDIDIEFIYNNINDFSVKDFFAENSFVKFKNLKIIIRNFVNNLCADYIEMYNSWFEENKAYVDYVHKKSIIYDKVEVIYDDRYINLQINKTNDYEEDPVRSTYPNIEFVPINLAYYWKAEIIKSFDSNIGEYYSTNGLKVEYSEPVNSTLNMLLPKEKFENTYYKSVRENWFSKVNYYGSNSDKFNLSWKLNKDSKKNEDVISFYKEKVE